jgi:hypothetical protein
MIAVLTIIYFLYICVECHMYFTNNQTSKIVRNMRAQNKDRYKANVIARTCTASLTAISLEESLLQALLLFVVVIDFYIYIKQSQVRLKL